MQSASWRSPTGDRIHDGPQLEIAYMTVPNSRSHTWRSPTGDRIHEGPQLEIAYMTVPNCRSHTWRSPTGDRMHDGSHLEMASMMICKWITSYCWTRQISTSFEYYIHYFSVCWMFSSRYYKIPFCVQLIYSITNSTIS
jgi:hypothetical protein